MWGNIISIALVARIMKKVRSCHCNRCRSFWSILDNCMQSCQLLMRRKWNGSSLNRKFHRMTCRSYQKDIDFNTVCKKCHMLIDKGLSNTFKNCDKCNRLGWKSTSVQKTLIKRKEKRKSIHLKDKNARKALIMIVVSSKWRCMELKLHCPWTIEKWAHINIQSVMFQRKRIQRSAMKSSSRQTWWICAPIPQ